MKNFIFKSTIADLQKMFTILDSKLDVIQKNVLYSTHQLDFIRQKILTLVIDKRLQKQVDDFVDEEETSHQTDSDEQ